MSSTDTTTQAPVTEKPKPAREKQATHYWLAADGTDKVGDTWISQEAASGYRYTSEGGWNFEYQVPGAAPGTVATMLALFGAKTLAINTASAARQAEVDQKEALTARFTKELYDGHWADERTGGGRAYDEDTIVQAVVNASKGKADAEKVRAKIAATTGGLQAYAKLAMTNKDVSSAYNKLKGKVEAKVDALF